MHNDKHDGSRLSISVNVASAGVPICQFQCLLRENVGQPKTSNYAYSTYDFNDEMSFENRTRQMLIEAAQI